MSKIANVNKYLGVQVQKKQYIFKLIKGHKMKASPYGSLAQIDSTCKLMMTSLRSSILLAFTCVAKSGTTFNSGLSLAFKVWGLVVDWRFPTIIFLFCTLQHDT